MTGYTAGSSVLLAGNNPVVRLVLLSEGFASYEMGVYNDICDLFVESLKAEPWFTEQIRVTKGNVVSTDTGVARASTCPGGFVPGNSFFGASFGGGGNCNLLTGDSLLARSTAIIFDAQMTATLVLGNSPHYGGSANYGLKVAYASTGTTLWERVAFHELGHLAGLDDEYDYQSLPDLSTNLIANYEPSTPNVTSANTYAGLKAMAKWYKYIANPGNMIVVGNPNPNCGSRNPDGAINGSNIGVIEGSGRYRCGLWRPSFGCTMRGIQWPFCSVCADEMWEWATG